MWNDSSYPIMPHMHHPTPNQLAHNFNCELTLQKPYLVNHKPISTSIHLHIKDANSHQQNIEVISWLYCDCCVLFGFWIACLLCLILNYRLYGVHRLYVWRVRDHQLLSRQVALLIINSQCFLMHVVYFLVECMCRMYISIMLCYDAYVD